MVDTFDWLCYLVCMNWMRKVVLVLVAVAFVQSATAQTILLLEKTTSPKRIKYFVGDRFAFRLENDRVTIRGTIDLITETALVVDDEYYQLNQIGIVLNYQKFAVLRALSKSALVAIPPMLVFTLLHRGLNTKEQPLLDRNSMQVMGVFATIGLVLWPFQAKKYKLQKKWQLRPLDVTPG